MKILFCILQEKSSGFSTVTFYFEFRDYAFRMMITIITGLKMDAFIFHLLLEIKSYRFNFFETGFTFGETRLIRNYEQRKFRAQFLKGNHGFRPYFKFIQFMG